MTHPIGDNAALRSMLAFDIETEGLDPKKHAVTCACVFNGQGVSETFLFKREDPEEDRRHKERFLELLDSAPRLCAFNGVRFDIPFLAQAWGLPAPQVESWVRKTVDVFEACKLGLGKTFGLDRLLACNGLESKTGTGLYAVQLARERRWEELGAYCMQDTRLTFLVTCQHQVALPLHTASRKLALQPAHPQPFVLW
jgi:hypothetical protein